MLLSVAALEPDTGFNTNRRKGSDMTDDNKRDDRKRNDDQDRKKLSDEELQDVAGGTRALSPQFENLDSVVCLA